MKETPTDRRLIIDLEKCFGCFACAAACPEKHIVFTDHEGLRRFRAPSLCSAQCDACRKACPVDAIVLEEVASEEPRPALIELTWGLPLTRCRTCGEAFTTEKIRRSLSDKLAAIVGSEDLSFDRIPLCPSCRRDDEAHRMRSSTRTLPDPLP